MGDTPRRPRELQQKPELDPGAVARANRIKQARFEMGWTQAELAKRVGVSEKAVTLWERALARPTEENVAALARLLKKSESWIDIGEEIMEQDMKLLLQQIYAEVRLLRLELQSKP